MKTFKRSDEKRFFFFFLHHIKSENNSINYPLESSAYICMLLINFKYIYITVFKYEDEEEYVMQVSRKSFETCNVSNPISIIRSGRDLIRLKALGWHYFFISGAPGHCELGQKLHIKLAPYCFTSIHSATPPALPPIPTSLDGPPISSPPASPVHSSKTMDFGSLRLLLYLIIIMVLLVSSGNKKKKKKDF